jgi:hypothetical protein
MLSVRYGNDVPAALAEVVEFHARAAGLSLGALEVIGESLDRVESFIVASEEGLALVWAQAIGVAPPTDNVGLARWQAQRLFGA